MGMPLTRIGIVSPIEQARWAAWDREVFLTPRTYASRVQEAGGKPLHQPLGLGQQVVVGMDGVHEPPVERLGGWNPLSEERHLERPRLSDRCRHE